MQGPWAYLVLASRLRKGGRSWWQVSRHLSVATLQVGRPEARWETVLQAVAVPNEACLHLSRRSESLKQNKYVVWYRMGKRNDCSNHTLLTPNATQPGLQRRSQQRRPGDEIHLSLTGGSSTVNTLRGGCYVSKTTMFAPTVYVLSEDKCKALVSTAASSEIFEAEKIPLWSTGLN